MKHSFYGCILFVFFYQNIQAQYEQLVQGKIVDAITGTYLENVVVTLEGFDYKATSNIDGKFSIRAVDLPLGEQILLFSKKGYIIKRFPVIINKNQILDLKKIDLEYDFTFDQSQVGRIDLSDEELDDDQSETTKVSGLLQSTRDVFLKAAAFDFSATFFRPRGLGSENGKVLINGIEMNKMYNGRPQWSNWGGLNDVQRNQEFSVGISRNEYTFGGLLGTSNIIMRASKYRKGVKLSYASSNRSYRGRIMATYSSGVLSNGWAYTTSLSRRYGNEGYIEGTLYDANSFFVSIEKRINKKHSLNLTGFYTPNRRGKSTAITNEVYEIKGNTYNPNWGYHNGKIRNARERKVEEPIVMFNHYWAINENTRINTNIAFQTGTVGTSRIDTGGSDLVIDSNEEPIYIGGGRSADTNPVHPENLPSYYLQSQTPTSLAFQNAFLAQQNLINNGQIQWDQLVATNQQNEAQGANATYILSEDRTNDTSIIGNVFMNSRLNDNLMINTAIKYRNLQSENFAEVADLLGGTGFLDVDVFALSSNDQSPQELSSRAQSDIRNPNRIVGVGDRYDYNFMIEATTIDGFIQGQYNYKWMDCFVSGRISKTSYQRNGVFENGYFPGDKSFGKSEHLDFLNYGIKGGVTCAIDGHNYIALNGIYDTNAPTIRNSFVNARQNNSTIAALQGGKQQSEKIESFDASYIFRSSKIKAKITGYYTKILDATNLSFFYTQALSGSDSGFVQEVVTDIDKLHIGGELGVEYHMIPVLKLKAAAAVGSYRYINNPQLTLTSTSEVFSDVQGIQDMGTSALKGYHISAGPERAIQFGFEYSDPNFWWFGSTINYFSNAYVNSSPFARTSNFFLDADGLPFNDYDENIAKDLLKQEKFDDYFLLNVIGGKSWRIKKYYVGFFASVNNVLNQAYKTGGFEQSRNANYRLALEESERKTPVYGTKYFYGMGTTYYFNMYLRF
ncbi:TonB-dependent receptor [Aquimarina pacifica]|uniref:TonB-dependent receptor n=1 Tax=Aquimarina pacifica TaxID=1296415 RepID=UPI00046E76E9|nr:TonB-dependent receptor [Aquimarina pacifica]